MTSAKPKQCGVDPSGDAPRSVSLSIVDHGHAHKPAKSRVSKWRAIVLITVNVLILAHIVVWLVSRSYGEGRTLSPVEPSETMYTLENGRINAGFVLFAGAIVSTVLFGRFFCGWGCHILAVQDLCSHIMTKIGVRPKPLRSRLLLWAPLLLALYMFVWPTFKRLALIPFFNAIDYLPPAWFIERPRPFLGFESYFIIKDYWRTFPTDWYVMVLFFGFCCFAAVYFLGSKGFCTYGCPYGGFFGVVDRFAVGRIVVNDNCEQCGHCTAACTSNVRVHQEVRDFGMVVDPGCMKCMDCVSVCPNDALSLSLSRPGIMAKPRTLEAKKGSVRRPEFDLTLGQDIVFCLACLFFVWAFRDMFLLSKVPLLMAAAMGLVAGFIAWKMWAMVREPHVRVQSVQLKHKGAVRPAGYVFILLAGAYLAVGVWSGVVKGIGLRAEMLDERVKTSADVVFSPGYKPSDKDSANAKAAVRLMRLIGTPAQGGIGWGRGAVVLRMSWLSAVAGDLESAETYVRESIATSKEVSANQVLGLASIMSLRGRTEAEVIAMQQEFIAQSPGLFDIRLALARNNLAQGRNGDAAKGAQEILAVAKPAPEPAIRVSAAEVLLHAGDMAGALKVIDEVLNSPESLENLNSRVQATKVLAAAGKGQRAVEVLESVIASEKPRASPFELGEVAGLLAVQFKQADRAEQVLKMLVERFPKLGYAHFQYAQLLGYLGKNEESLAEVRRASEADPFELQYLDAEYQLLSGLARPAEAAVVLTRIGVVRGKLGLEPLDPNVR